MLNKNGSFVNFTILHSNYLVAERHKVNGVYEYSVHSWASTTNLSIDTTLHGAMRCQGHVLCLA